MVPFMLTTLTEENSPIHQNTKIRGILLEKTLRKFIYQTFNVSNFKPTSRITFYKTSTNKALKHFKLAAIAEMSYQFTFNEA